MKLKIFLSGFLLLFFVVSKGQVALSIEEKLQIEYAIQPAELKPLSQKTTASAVKVREQWQQQLKQAKEELNSVDADSPQGVKLQTGVRRLEALLDEKKSK